MLSGRTRGGLPVDQGKAMQAPWVEVILKGHAPQCGPLDEGTHWQVVLGYSPGRRGTEANLQQIDQTEY